MHTASKTKSESLNARSRRLPWHHRKVDFSFLALTHHILYRRLHRQHATNMHTLTHHKPAAAMTRKERRTGSAVIFFVVRVAGLLCLNIFPASIERAARHRGKQSAPEQEQEGEDSHDSKITAHGMMGVSNSILGTAIIVTASLPAMPHGLMPGSPSGMATPSFM